MHDKYNVRLLGLTLLNFMLGYGLSIVSKPIAFLVMVFAESILIILYIKRREERISAITTQLQKLNNNDYSFDLNAYVEGEIARLQSEIHKTTVNVRQMNLLLSEQTKVMVESLEDISHQLKTPLASLLILNELQDSKDELVIKSHAQIQRLNYLVQSLLKMAKLDSKTEVFNITSFDLKQCVQEALDLALPSSLEIKIKNQVSDTKVFADYNKTVEAVLNILTNKLRYAKTTISISSKEQGLNTFLYISDDGETIDRSQRTKLFERFYHSNDSKDGSVGLGLSISKAIMIGQEGKLYIEGDNTFVFVFKRF